MIKKERGPGGEGGDGHQPEAYCSNEAEAHWILTGERTCAENQDGEGEGDQQQP